MSYIFEHEGRQYSPDGRVNVPDAAAFNRELEAAELAVWQTKPDRFLAYVVDNKATTWLGTELGRVITVSKFKNNLTGSRMEHIRVRGINGAWYHGTYGSDWRQCVRLRRVAERAPR